MMAKCRMSSLPLKLSGIWSFLRGKWREEYVVCVYKLSEIERNPTLYRFSGNWWNPTLYRFSGNWGYHPRKTLITSGRQSYLADISIFCWSICFFITLIKINVWNNLPFQSRISQYAYNFISSVRVIFGG